MTCDRDFKDETIRVRKRDGSVEPFSVAKLLNSIQRGLAAGDELWEPEGLSSRGLAEAVFGYLKEASSGRTVTTAHLSELVDLVLTQTGHVSAFMAIKNFAEHRDRQRRWVRVAGALPKGGRYVQRQWDKTRLIASLRTTHQLDEPVARLVAGRVEQLVLNCGLRVVTSGLVAEMTRSELLAWGLVPAAFKVKLPREKRNARKR